MMARTSFRLARNCSAFADITGAVLIGLAPLMLSYLIVAALASLMAAAPEK